MRLRSLRIVGVRCIREAALEIEEDLVVLVGANGAGKTTVLEAIHLLGYGRSFRGGGMEALLRVGAEELAVAGVVEREGRVIRGDWRWTREGGLARVEGVPCPKSALLSLFRVLAQHPESHALVQGGRELRRRFLDWLLFHVEPGFWSAWKTFRRALRQRNAALRAQADDRSLAAWEPALAQAGEWIAARRRQWLARLAHAFRRLSERLAPGLSAPELVPVDGWPEGTELRRCLEQRRVQDRIRGRTECGPHRGGFELRYARLTGERLSRGQAKLAALALLLAAAEVFHELGRGRPVVLLDDFAAELDRAHQRATIEFLAECGGQVWMSVTELPASVQQWPRTMALFHVERGLVRRAKDL